MKKIIYILLFLLMISIINNYILHKYCDSQNKISLKDTNYLIDPVNLPKNIGVASLYIFYNKNLQYGKCYIDQKTNNKDMSKEPYELVNLNNIINDIYKKNNDKCYIINTNENKKINLNNHLNDIIKKVI